MGFTLSESMEAAVKALVNSKDWDPEQATPIPDSGGMVLVKRGTKAFLERVDAGHVFMIPVKLKSQLDGETLLCFVCTS